MIRGRLARTAGAATALAAWLTIGSCGEAATPAEPALAHVGRATCARCHAAELARWTGSHHDRAIEEASPDSVLGDFDDAEFTHHGTTSRFSRRDGRFWVHTDGPDGRLRDYPIRYTFGFDPLQQYLIELGGGRLQALGVAWDARPRTQGGQRWFHLYPDEPIPHDDVLHWTGPYQSWNRMCAECHSTALDKGYDAARDVYATTWQELDVSCEACHGAGSRHVAWAERGADRSEPHGLAVGRRANHAWVFDEGARIARREPPSTAGTEVETCAACHSRRSAITRVATPGQPFLDGFRPALLDEGLYHVDGQIDDEVYVWGSFVQSKMHAAGVTCSDCHDPHDLRLIAPGNAVCTRCHVASAYDTPAHHFHPSGSPGAACVACHMPERTYMVVDPRRDHGFRVPRPDLTVALGTPNACATCHADRPAAWAQRAIEAHRESHPAPRRDERPDFAAALHAGRRGTRDAHAALTAVARDARIPAIARATALSLFERQSTPPSEDLLRQALRDDDGLVRLAAVEALEHLQPAHRLALAGALLTDPLRSVRTAAARVLAPARTAAPRDVASRLDDALAEYVETQRVAADRPESHVNLGVLALTRGDHDAAEAAYRTALRLEPGSVVAAVNLADLLRERSRDAEGEAVLRAVLARDPGAAEAHHALGLLLVREKRNAEGIEALERAAALRPENARFWFVLGVALQSAKSTERAVAVLEEAQRRHPGDRDLLIALATTHRDRGDLPAAVRAARELAALAPGDASVAALLRELESLAARRR